MDDDTTEIDEEFGDDKFKIKNNLKEVLKTRKKYNYGLIDYNTIDKKDFYEYVFKSLVSIDKRLSELEKK